MRTQARLERLETQAGVGDRSNIIPGGIRIFEPVDYETQEELDAAVDEYLKEYGKDNVKVGRDSGGRIIAIEVHCRPDHRPQAEGSQQQVKAAEPRPKQEPQPEPEPQRAAVSQTQPKRAKRKPKPEPEPEPELQPEPTLTAGERRRRRRKEAFRRWRLGEDLY